MRGYTADMIRSHRKIISLIMSAVLTIFSLCQVQAWAAIMPAMTTAQISAEPVAMPDCHRAKAASDMAMPDCHSVCQQLTQHPDVSIKLSSLDPSPLILAIVQPYALLLAPQAMLASYHPPDPLAVNPPPIIRYQRLLN